MKTARGIKLTKNKEQRLLSSFTKLSRKQCWRWNRRKNTQGYGMINLFGKPTLAHRATYEYFRKQIPSDKELDHLCRNTWCVNPWHLEPVTHALNCFRGQAPGIIKYRKKFFEAVEILLEEAGKQNGNSSI